MLQVVKPDRKKPHKRYLLINPPIEEPYRARISSNGDKKTPKYVGRYYTFPLPIGLLRIAGQLLADGNEIYFLNCFSSLPAAYPCSCWRTTPSDEPEFMLTRKHSVQYTHLGMRYGEIRRILDDVTADEVFVGCTFTYHNEPAHKVIELCRETLGNAKITFGGIYPTLAPGIARTSMADEVFTGAYPGAEKERLNYDFLGVPPGFILIKGTSGCPNKCAYCAVHRLEGNRFTHREPDDVFDEIVAVHKRFGLTHIGMWDSNVLMHYSDYFGAILKRIRDAELPVQMSAPEGFDYRLLTTDVAKNLKAANFKQISLALENNDTSYTRNILNRTNNLDRLMQAIRDLKRAGFADHQIQLFVIVGLPGQTIESVIDNIRYVWDHGCNVTLFPFTPIPGTPLYEQSLPQVRDLPLKALHPSLFSCVDDDHIQDMLIELSSLASLSRSNRTQRDNFREVINNPQLLEMLSVSPKKHNYLLKKDKI